MVAQAQQSDAGINEGNNPANKRKRNAFFRAQTQYHEDGHVGQFVYAESARDGRDNCGDGGQGDDQKTLDQSQVRSVHKGKRQVNLIGPDEKGQSIESVSFKE